MAAWPTYLLCGGAYEQIQIKIQMQIQIQIQIQIKIQMQIDQQNPMQIHHGCTNTN